MTQIMLVPVYNLHNFNIDIKAFSALTRLVGWGRASSP